MRSSPPSRKTGFTLLEVMLSIAVFILLITAAFSLMSSTTELIAEVSEVESSSAVRMRFIESCRLAFEEMTSESNLEFDYVDRGGSASDTYLSLVDAPGAFDFGMNLHDEISRVVLAAEIRPDGFIRSGIYFATEIEWLEAKENNFSSIDSLYVELIPRMTQLTWQFYDATNPKEKWRGTLDGNFETSLLKLTIITEDQITPIESTFWVLQRR